MRLKLFLIILATSISVNAQKDTIQVSKNTAVVIFPSNISDAYLGDELEFYMDEKNREGSAFAKRILKLYYNEASIKRKAYTSLLVITTNGNSYEFVLESGTNPKQRTWYISPDQAVTNILGKQISNTYQKGDGIPDTQTTMDTLSSGNANELQNSFDEDNENIEKETTVPTAELYEKDPKEYFRLRCYYMQFDSSKIPRFFARSGDVFLWLKGVYYNENEIYVQLRIENRESVDWDLKLLKFSIATSYNKSSSNQKTELDEDDIEYRFKVPERVKGNTENHFVVVLKKFSLDRNKVLAVDMDEENGNRSLSLEIDNAIINNPFKIK